MNLTCQCSIKNCKKMIFAKEALRLDEITRKGSLINRRSVDNAGRAVTKFLCLQCITELIGGILSSAKIGIPRDLGSYRVSDYQKLLDSNLMLMNHFNEIIDKVNGDDDFAGSEIHEVGHREAEVTHSRSTTRNPTKFTAVRKKNDSSDMRQFENLLGEYSTPKQIYEELKKSVIEQDEALKQVSVAFYIFLKSLKDPNIKKFNTLLTGSTGTGKTQTFRKLMQMTGYPGVAINCRTLSPSSYKGDNVTMIPEKLVAANDKDALEGPSIILLDEMDKLCIPKDASDESRWKGKAVQEELLKLLEGDEMIASNHRGEQFSCDTSKIFIIGAGSFGDYSEKKAAKKSKRTIGMVSTETSEPEFQMSQFDIEHLLEAGLIKELVGRFTSVAAMKDLTPEMIKSIMKNSEDSPIHSYKALFGAAGATLIFEEDFFDKIAQEAHKRKTGARGIDQAIDKFMNPFLFDIEEYYDKTVVITANGMHLEEQTFYGESA